LCVRKPAPARKAIDVRHTDVRPLRHDLHSGQIFRLRTVQLFSASPKVCSQRNPCSPGRQRIQVGDRWCRQTVENTQLAGWHTGSQKRSQLFQRSSSSADIVLWGALKCQRRETNPLCPGARRTSNIAATILTNQMPIA